MRPERCGLGDEDFYTTSWFIAWFMRLYELDLAHLILYRNIVDLKKNDLTHRPKILRTNSNGRSLKQSVDITF